MASQSHSNQMTEELIKIALREIRQSYYSSINDWALNDRDQMVSNLKVAREKTTGLIEFLEGLDGTQFRKKRTV